MLLRLVSLQFVLLIAFPWAIWTVEKLSRMQPHMGPQAIRGYHLLATLWAFKRWLAMGELVPSSGIFGDECHLARFALVTLPNIMYP